jgi:hypothetical protein
MELGGGGGGLLWMELLDGEWCNDECRDEASTSEDENDISLWKRRSKREEGGVVDVPGLLVEVGEGIEG